jgi:hypothetical protein
LVALAAVAAVAAVTVAAAVIGWSGRGGAPRADAGAVPSTAPCVATFSVQRDWGRGFDATLIVVNNGPALHGWSIAFDFTGGQRLVTATAATAVVSAAAGDRSRHTATLRQTGQTVTASNPQQTLGQHDSVTVPLTGRYTKTNSIPLDYRLNDRRCVARVAGAANQPTPPSGGGRPGAGTGGPSGSGGPAIGGPTDQSPAPAPGTTAPSTQPPATTPPAPAPSTTAPPPPPPPPPPTGGGGDGGPGPGDPSHSSGPHRH